MDTTTMVTMEQAKGLVFAAGEQVVVHTHVSGVAKKGGEVVATLPHIKYKLVVDLSGVAVSTLVDTMRYANLSVRSQAWLKGKALEVGAEGVKKMLTPEGKALEHKRPSDTVKYDHLAGGELRVTWEELFKAERSAAAPAVKAEAELRKMEPEEKKALLERLLAEMAGV